MKRKRLIVVLAARLGLVMALGLFAGLAAQDGPGSPGSETVAQPRRPATSQPASSSPDSSAPASSVPAASGDTSGDLPKIPSKLAPKNTGGPPAAVFSSDTNLVTVDVKVVDNKNNFVADINRKYFRILEDNVPQTIKQFSVGQSPMTVALVIEFSGRFQWYGSAAWFQTLQTANAFLSTLKPDDYAAIIRYDLRPKIVVDFTNDRGRLQQALRSFTFPDFSEANLFDALTDTADRMSKVEGRKAILVLTSGVDTFSKMTFDQARRKLQDSGVPIYSVGLLQMQRMMNEGRGGMGGAMNDLTFLQADNEMKTFTKDTGGQAFFPRFPGELGEVFNSILGAIRDQYTLAYSSSNQEKDGKFRKITVQLIDPENNQPIVFYDNKHKPLKYTIVAKPGYQAPRAVE
jgi:Ca-activated chloride channel homolog